MERDVPVARSAGSRKRQLYVTSFVASSLCWLTGRQLVQTPRPGRCPTRARQGARGVRRRAGDDGRDAGMDGAGSEAAALLRGCGASGGQPVAAASRGL